MCVVEVDQLWPVTTFTIFDNIHLVSAYLVLRRVGQESDGSPLSLRTTYLWHPYMVLCVRPPGMRRPSLFGLYCDCGITYLLAYMALFHLSRDEWL